MAWIGAVASIAGSMISSSMQGDAAGDASAAQTEATMAGIGEQRRQFNLNRTDLAPWRLAGTAAVNRIAHLMGLTPEALAAVGANPYDRFYNEALQRAPRVTSMGPGGRWVQQPGYGDVGAAPAVWTPMDVETSNPDLAWARAEADRLMAEHQARTGAASSDADFGLLTRRFTMSDFDNDPVIQASFDFGLSEGEKAVRRMFGARGMGRSGAAIRAATRFANDYTSQRAGESRARFVNDQDTLYNRLAGISGTGQTATTNTAEMGSRITSNIADMTVGLGNARGAAAIARGNAAAGGFGNLGTTISDAIRRSPASNANQFYTMGDFTPYYTGLSFDGSPAYG